MPSLVNGRRISDDTASLILVTPLIMLLTVMAMKVGDCGFFYHSQTDKQIVGIVKIISAAHPDTTDTTGKWSCVDIVAVKPLTRPISLATIKQNPLLDDMVLVRNSRLSVQPVTKEQWRIILALSLTS